MTASVFIWLNVMDRMDKDIQHQETVFPSGCSKQQMMPRTPADQLRDLPSGNFDSDVIEVRRIIDCAVRRPHSANRLTS